MEQWQRDLIEEERSVSDRIAGLNSFIGGDYFFATSELEQDLVMEQLNEAVDYDIVLIKRIRTFR